MAQLTVRDVDPGIAEALKRRAVANGRSAEAEHRQILKDVLGGSDEAISDFAASAARLRVRLSHDGDSTEILRAMRDRDTE